MHMDQENIASSSSSPAFSSPVRTSNTNDQIDRQPLNCSTPPHLIAQCEIPQTEIGVFNPFDGYILESLHKSVLSPSVFSRVVSPNMETPPSAYSQELRRKFRWSIDHMASLHPADIDESHLHHQYQCNTFDPENEARAQRSIDEFFSQNQIAPSPLSSAGLPNREALASTSGSPRSMQWSQLPLHFTLMRSQQKQQTYPSRLKAIDANPHPGSCSPLVVAEKRQQIASIPTTDVACQTLVTMPVDFDLLALLGNRFKYNGDSLSQTVADKTSVNASSEDSGYPASSSTVVRTASDPGNLSISTLRRKLFATNTADESKRTSSLSLIAMYEDKGGKRKYYSCRTDTEVLIKRCRSCQNSFAASSSSSSSSNSSILNTGNQTSQNDKAMDDNLDDDDLANECKFSLQPDNQCGSAYMLSSSPVPADETPIRRLCKRTKPNEEYESKCARERRCTFSPMKPFSSPDISPIKDND